MSDPSQDREPLVATPGALRELVDHIRQAGRFAFDTEFVSEETFEPVLCLVQVATDTRLAVVDPFQVGDLKPFWDVVVDPSIDVVMHAAGEDLRICRLQTGTLPQRVFDVQIAAGLVGFGYPLSPWGTWSIEALKVSLLGGETRTDWRRRPLSEGQLRYALEDVRHLLELADLLGGELERLDRVGWAEDEFASFLDGIEHRADGGAAHGGSFPACTCSTAVAWKSRGGSRNGEPRTPDDPTARSGASSATTSWSRLPSGSRPPGATSKPSATSTAPTS